MTASDVVEGKKFIMLGDEGIYRGKILYVIMPNCLYKAFMACDGCRYGLEDCYVKITN